MLPSLCIALGGSGYVKMQLCDLLDVLLDSRLRGRETNSGGVELLLQRCFHVARFGGRSSRYGRGLERIDARLHFAHALRALGELRL